MPGSRHHWQADTIHARIPRSPCALRYRGKQNIKIDTVLLLPKLNLKMLIIVVSLCRKGMSSTAAFIGTRHK